MELYSFPTVVRIDIETPLETDMASRPEILPEGTDSVIGGASDGGTAEQIEAVTSAARNTADRLREEAAGLTSQAAAKARDYVAQGKDRATDALDGLSKAVGEVASTVDQQVGSQYGDYARRAADALSAFSSDLRGKELDELYADAQRMVRSSPAIAIGTAAAVGFALVRLLKSGVAAAEEAATAAQGTVDRASAYDEPSRSPSEKSQGGTSASRKTAKKAAKPSA